MLAGGRGRPSSCARLCGAAATAAAVRRGSPAPAGHLDRCTNRTPGYEPGASFGMEGRRRKWPRLSLRSCAQTWEFGKCGLARWRLELGRLPSPRNPRPRALTPGLCLASNVNLPDSRAFAQKTEPTVPLAAAVQVRLELNLDFGTRNRDFAK